MKKCCNDPKPLTSPDNQTFCQNCHKEIPKPKMGEVDMLFVRTKDLDTVGQKKI